MRSQVEYFKFGNIKSIVAEFEKAALLTSYHRERTKVGMERARTKGHSLGRPKQAEKTEKFLNKPKSKEIAGLLAEGLALREIQRRTGYAINTIRKVNDVLKEG